MRNICGGGRRFRMMSRSKHVVQAGKDRSKWGARIRTKKSQSKEQGDCVSGSHLDTFLRPSARPFSDF
jgi:hypothetical protein